MEAPADKRKYPRLQIPVPVDSNDLPEHHLNALDVSAGGLFIVVRGLPEAPPHGRQFHLSFQVAGNAFDDCTARVAWTQKNKPGIWGIGLEVTLSEEQREKLTRSLYDGQS